MSEPTQEELLRFVKSLAAMPSTDENMHGTWSPPEWDDLCDWWREFVDAARNLTGVSYSDFKEPTDD